MKYTRKIFRHFAYKAKSNKFRRGKRKLRLLQDIKTKGDEYLELYNKIWPEDQI